MVRGHGAAAPHVVSWKHDRLATAWVKLVEEATRQAIQAEPAWKADARVALEIAFTLPEAQLGGPDEPDLDNLVKLALDALQRAGGVSNDRLVVRLSAAKQFSDERCGMAAVLTQAAAAPPAAALAQARGAVVM
jgi:hypothetical protein